jgi:hypothetical protein
MCRKINVGAADRFFRIEAPQAFLNFGAAGEILFIISTPHLNILERILAPQANF